MPNASATSLACANISTEHTANTTADFRSAWRQVMSKQARLKACRDVCAGFGVAPLLTPPSLPSVTTLNNTMHFAAHLMRSRDEECSLLCQESWCLVARRRLGCLRRLTWLPHCLALSGCQGPLTWLPRCLTRPGCLGRLTWPPRCSARPGCPAWLPHFLGCHLRHSSGLRSQVTCQSWPAAQQKEMLE